MMRHADAACPLMPVERHAQAFMFQKFENSAAGFFVGNL